MIIEAQSELGGAMAVFIVLGAVCAAGFFWFLRRKLFVAFGLALVGAGLVAAPSILQISARAKTVPFDVVVVNDNISENGFLHHMSLRGGVYKAPDGQEVALERAETWPMGATLILNDSQRLITVRRFHYASTSELTAGTPLMQVVFPGEQGLVEGSIYAVEFEGTPPPSSIKADSAVAVIDILFRSDGPYDPAKHGDRDKLLAEREVMNPRMDFRKPLKP